MFRIVVWLALLLGGCPAMAQQFQAAPFTSQSPITATGGSAGRTLAAWFADRCNVMSFGADPTGSADSSSAFNSCNATGKSIYAPAGTYHLASPVTIGSTSGTTSQYLIGDGWNTIIDVSTDFSTSAAGVVILAVPSTYANVQYGVDSVHFVFHQPQDATTTTTASTAASGTTITVASVPSTAVVGSLVVDATNNAALPMYINGLASQAAIQSISGNVITLTKAVVTGQSVGNGDTIDFARPRSTFTTLSSGCSLTAGSPGCKYPWAIYNNGSGNSYVNHVLFEQAWDGLYMRGGTYFVNNLYGGTYDQLFNQDNTHNFPHLDDLQLWDFLPGSGNYSALGQVYYDGSAVCANLGANDGLAAGSLQCWIGQLNLTANWSWGSFGSISMDGADANFSYTASAGSWAQIGNFYSTKPANPQAPAILMNGVGSVYINQIQTSGASSTGQLAPSNIQVEAGNLHIYGGTIGDFDLVNDSAVSGGLLDIRNVALISGSGCNTTPFFHQTGGALQMVNVTFPTQCSNSGRVGVEFDADNSQNVLKGNIYNGWGVALPSSGAPYVGTYDGFNSGLAVSVDTFGADPTDTNDSTTAINNAISYIEAHQSVNSNIGGKLIFTQGATYKTTGIINLTAMTSKSFELDGNGATLDCQATGDACIDAIGSRYLHVAGLHIIGNSTNVPKIGLQIGRDNTTSNDSADNDYIDNVFIEGNFSLTAMYNLNAETSTFVRDKFWNSASAAYSLIQDGINHFQVATLASGGQQQPANTPQSFNENVFINCDIRETGGSGAIPIWMAGTSRHTYIGGYVANTASSYGAALYSYAGSDFNTMLDMDVHFETSSLTDIFFVTGPEDTPTFNWFRYKDQEPFATNSVFKADTNITGILMRNATIDIGYFGGGASKVFDAPSLWTLTGKYYSPALTQWNAPSTFQGCVVTGSAYSCGSFATWTDTQTCTPGQISVDASYIYVCTATNTVKRASLSTF